MSQLTLTLLQLGFLVLLWVLVIAVLRVLRRDLYGTRVVPRTADGGRTRGASRPAVKETPRGPAGPTQLVVTEGSLRGTTLTLGQAPVLIGRSPECTLVLTDDFASGRHARLSPSEQGWVVEDLGSTNGTQLGGAPLTGAAVLAVGAQLRIGRTVIELRR